MAYTPYYTGGWQSGEEGGTPITPAALNNMEAGIEAANAIGDPVTIAHGGTGGATAAAARTNLGITAAVWLTNNDTTWADLWNLLSVVPTSGTSTIYANGAPASMISGGAIASACDGFVARYGSGLGFNFTLVQQTTGKLFNVVVTFNSAHDDATVGTVYAYAPNTRTDVSSQFTFADGWGGTIQAYKQNNIIELYVAISTVPTLAANTLYSGVITVSGAAYGPVTNVLTYASRSSTFNKKGADYMACFTHASAGGSISISTGDTIGSGSIRFTMTYIAN